MPTTSPRNVCFLKEGKVCNGLRIQPVDATHSLNISAGVWKPSVLRGLREHGHGGRPRKAVASELPAPATFVAVSMPPASPIVARSGDGIAAMMDVQARLPNGVAIDLRGVELRNVGEVIEALGRLRCSASTKD